MNISFKNITRAFFVSALSVAFLSGCSKWTEPKSIKFEYLTLEQKNPELFQAYMESLREYRDSDHKVVIAKFDNSSSTPSGRAEHINCVPDSVDYVVLVNPSEVSDQLLADMEDLQVNKKTEVFGQISISDILESYKLYKEQWMENHSDDPAAEGDVEVEEMLSYDAFISQQMPLLMEPFKKYPFDGINIIYYGQNPENLTEEKAEVAKTEQQAFFSPIMEWVNAKEGRKYFIEGTPQYLLLEDDLASKAEFILVPAQSAQVLSEFTHVVNKVLSEKNVPSDKIVVVVTTIDLNDPTIKNGHFSDVHSDGSSMTAIEGAAFWSVSTYKNITPRGIAIDHAQNDYFNLKMVYSETRSAISIMNPSPLK